MDRAGLPRPRRRWLATSLGAAGALWLVIGCSHPMQSYLGYGPPSAPPLAPSASSPGIVQAGHLAPAVPTGTYEVPVTLEIVLRMAEAQNARIALAREHVHEAQLTYQAAVDACLPNAVRRTTAASQVWRSKAELSQTISEVLPEAANTYFDLLAARRGEAIGHDLEQSERVQLRRAEKLVENRVASANVLLESVRAILANREHTMAKLRHQGNAAAAKLAYLLALPPGHSPVPSDDTLAPVELVDATPPTGDLVAQAQANGPGVRELEGLIAVIQHGIEEMTGVKAVLAGLHSGNLMHPNYQRCVANSKLRQAQLTLQDVREKLAAGVTEARDAVLNSRVQIGVATGQVSNAGESYRLSEMRLDKGATGATASEVLTTLRALELAHFNRITSIADYNKSQMRLMQMLGSPTGRWSAAGPISGGCP